MNPTDELEPGQLCDCGAPAYRRPDGTPVPVRVRENHPGVCVCVEQIDTGRLYPVGLNDLTPWSAEREAAWNEGQP